MFVTHPNPTREEIEFSKIITTEYKQDESPSSRGKDLACELANKHCESCRGTGIEYEEFNGDYYPGYCNCLNHYCEE